MGKEEAERLQSLYAWFKSNLPVPTRFSLSSTPHAKAQALSWFRDSATEHISRMRGYHHLLEAYGISVAMLRTNRPGYIVYEDEHRVVAYTFADTSC